MPIDATRCQPQLNLAKLELGLDTSVLFWMAGWVDGGWVAWEEWKVRLTQLPTKLASRG